MKAVIVAAGLGTRQKSRGDSKPLIPVLKISLIERVILTAKKSGITKFCIVIGYNGDKIKNYLGNGNKLGAEIEYVQNDEWEKANGISVFKAKSCVKDSFILLMADHIFDSRILDNLLETDVAKDECILCVDKNIPTYLDIEDATKVFSENNRITNIGKELKKYNMIDTGIFLCNPIIFDALEESIKKGDDSISGGIRVLAQRNKMKSLTIGNYVWIDVDTEKDLQNAEKLLLKDLK